jgi:hypothetical protein
MRIETFNHTAKDGWSVDDFPNLDSENSVVFAFGSPYLRDDPGPVMELLAAYPNSRFMACSTAGEIFETSIQDQSLAVAVAEFERSQLRCTAVRAENSADSFDVGCNIAKKLIAPDLRAIFVLSNGTMVNGSELVRGLNEVLPDEVVVTGGLAGDGDRFEETWVLDNRELATNSVSAVGFYGDHVEIGHGSKGGWDVFGPQRRVTRSESNILYELDGKPALDLYKEYLGDLASELPSSALLFPLSLRLHPEDERNVVRTILGVNEDDQSLTFAGDIPTGSYAQLMKANFERLIGGASEAAQMIVPSSNSGKGESLSIAISCVGRRLVLGEHSEEELEAALDVLPKDVHQVGFYSYGELSPYTTGACDLHNQTMTLTLFQEN